MLKLVKLAVVDTKNRHGFVWVNPEAVVAVEQVSRHNCTLHMFGIEGVFNVELEAAQLIDLFTSGEPSWEAYQMEVGR
jgi:hypothetical protein